MNSVSISIIMIAISSTAAIWFVVEVRLGTIRIRHQWRRTKNKKHQVI